MRLSAPSVTLALAVLIAGCGGASVPQPKAHAATPRSDSTRGSYTVWVAERPTPGTTGAGATSFNLQYGFAYNEPKLTRAQAIRQAERVAHRSSPVVRDVTCRQVRRGWRCEYTG